MLIPLVIIFEEIITKLFIDVDIDEADNSDNNFHILFSCLCNTFWLEIKFLPHDYWF